MKFPWVCLGLFVSVSFQAAIGEKRQSGPSVTIANGTVIGTTSNNVESFKGIPFAQPPVGARRLRPPATLASSFGTISATADGRVCPPASPPANQPAGNPEDCFYLNVQRFSGTRAGSNFPVVVYFYGGGFGQGSTVGIDAAALLPAAVSVGEPFVWVVANYRLAGFGFLASRELSAEGSTNLGLRDQRFVLQWVQDNIRAFGGDPAKVTIWGESAGSFSVLDHLIINNANNEYKGGRLFRAGIMSSGTALPAFPVSHPRPQRTFDKLVQTVGCTSATNKLDCLRGVSYDSYQQAQASANDGSSGALFLYGPRPDPASSFFPVSPEKALLAGNFLKVPLIAGNQEDEGTVFVTGLSSFSYSTAGIVTLLTAQFPELSNADATAFVNTYPEAFPARVTDGSPFRTGYANELFTGYKRIAAVVGDYLFTLSRRVSLDSMAGLTPVWSSLGTYLYNQNGAQGTQHGVDTSVVLFGDLSNQVYVEKKFRYISFWSYADPNYLGVNGNSVRPPNPNYGQWPQYTLSTRQLANFEPNTASLLTDNFRQSSYLEMKRNISRFAS